MPLYRMGEKGKREERENSRRTEKEFWRENMGWERGGGGGDTKKSRRRRRSGRKRTQLAQRNISKARVKERESERKKRRDEMGRGGGGGLGSQLGF